jgi:hypothetical protein
METQLSEGYKAALREAEECALAKTWHVPVSDPHVQIYSTSESKTVGIKVHGRNSVGIFEAFVRHLKGQNMEASWKDGVGRISYVPRGIKE